MSRIAVIGSGYVGLTTAACFADLGNDVTAIDIDESRISELRRGRIPFYEPGLADLVARNASDRRLSFTSRWADGLEGAEFAFLAVGTPTGQGGRADLEAVRSAAQTLGDHRDRPQVLVTKSTVPIGTGDMVTRIIEESRTSDAPFALVSNPEFLREGSAIWDFMNPNRIVLGCNTPQVANSVADLYRPMNAPVMITDLYTAEMIKYASNAFLATKISFINEIARICELLNADVGLVADGMGLDVRIGRSFLDAGVGFGGSCFPKDVLALKHMAEEHGYHPELLTSVLEVNREMRQHVIELFEETLLDMRGLTIAVLGLSFKPNTDDVREAPALEVVEKLIEHGAKVTVHDPVAMDSARRVLGDRVTYAASPYSAIEGADGVAVLTEWGEFRALDMFRVRSLMRGDVLIDGRNIYNRALMHELGFRYRGIGRA
jgi:UDPglucose 6-dehydrogenase